MLLLFLLLAQQLSPDADRLWEAARRGDLAGVKAVVAKGVDVNSRFRYNTTALWHAAGQGHLDIVRVLLEAGADPNLKDDWIGTPLVNAAFRNQADVVRLLLDKGASFSDSALTAAAQMGSVPIVKLLLDKGRPNADSLSSALESAQQVGQKEVAAILEKAGAKPPVKPVVKVSPETLKSYTGHYQSRSGLEFSFSIKDDALHGGNIFEDPVAWHAVDQTTFRQGQAPPFGPPPGVISFTLEDGKVTGFALKGPTPVSFRKVAQP